jgi:hypothetical protein
LGDAGFATLSLGLYNDRRARAKGAALLFLADKVFAMARPLIIIAVLLAILIGGITVLAGLNGEKPLTRVEKVVPLASLQK